jgi:hypothetical protein
MLLWSSADDVVKSSRVVQRPYVLLISRGSSRHTEPASSAPDDTVGGIP